MHGRGMAAKSYETDDSSVWLSVGDLMSVLLMIFALLLISALAQVSKDFERTHDTRVEIIEDMNRALTTSGVEVRADPETGEIAILDSILFDVNQSILKPSGQQFLDAFIPIYAKTIFQREKTAREINQIIIEGHSSSEGEFNHNMTLRVLRANSVAEYINRMTFDNKHSFFQKILVAGRGSLDSDKINPIDADRKVKFRFQFKDQKFLEEFQHMVDEQPMISGLTETVSTAIPTTSLQPS